MHNLCMYVCRILEENK
uniref:Uncharacterized protein n=1 Tax=Rhizophora mucronata TaxID=61149 RepID=A0A2P2QBV3_RHIMU